MDHKTMKPNPERMTCISIIVCDDVYRDEASKKLILVGTFNNVATFKLPCKATITILFTLTNGHGTYDLRLSIEHEQTGEEVISIGGPMIVDDPLRISDFNVKLANVPLPFDGKYWVVLRSEGEILQQRPFFVSVQPTTETGDAKEHENG